MRYVVGFMMVAFFLGGAGLFIAGALGLARRFAARRRLRPVQGEIVRIDVRTKVTDSESNRSADYHYPEIRFRPEFGDEITFLSEIGAGARAKRYAVGQKIAVLYDPDDELAPVINWGPNVLRVIFGPMFVGAAVGIYWAFGDKIFGP
jgi:hypothetical protein